MNKPEDIIKNLKSKYKEGFTDNELKELLDKYPEINKEKFNNALFGNTCMRINNETINYHHDVYKAIECGIENRELRTDEWD